MTLDFPSLAAVYLVIHFLCYGFFLRRLKIFNEEKIIFFYHAVSFAALLALGAVLAALDRGAFIPIVAAISLHGIYSLSFLELWALSDGGYSLRILDQCERFGVSVDFNALKNLGASKKKFRLNSLKRLGLVAEEAQQWVLTPRGRLAAGFLSFFVFISKQKETV